MKPFHELLETSAAAHGHLCPGQVVGVRMAMLGCRLIGLDEPTRRDQIKKLIVYVDGPLHGRRRGPRDRGQAGATQPEVHGLRHRQLPGLQDVTSDMLIKNPQVNVEIDRDKASALRVTANQIEDALYSAYGAREISTIYTPINQYAVIIELEPQYQLDPSALSMLYIRSSTGQLVPLNTVANLSRGLGPLSVNHLGQIPSVTISFNIKPGVSLGDAVSAVEKLARATLAATISTSFQGTAQAFQASMKGIGLLLIMAIVVIYIVLGILYESNFIHPLTSPLGSAFRRVWGFSHASDFQDGLKPLLHGRNYHVDWDCEEECHYDDRLCTLDAQRNQGKSPADGIYEGCLIRFRPIMMTTMAALMGTLPIALGLGAGAESGRPLGLVFNFARNSSSVR